MFWVELKAEHVEAVSCYARAFLSVSRAQIFESDKNSELEQVF